MDESEIDEILERFDEGDFDVVSSETETTIEVNSVEVDSEEFDDEALQQIIDDAMRQVREDSEKSPETTP